jgi:hypothetical protein
LTPAEGNNEEEATTSAKVKAEVEEDIYDGVPARSIRRDD